MKLNDAIVVARALLAESGEAQTVLVEDGEFTVLTSHEYAVLHENFADGALMPVLSFLPSGGVDAARPAFQPLADALAAGASAPLTEELPHV